MKAEAAAIDNFPDDGKLVKAFQAGDSHVFDQLVRRHQDKVFNVCFWILGDYQEAHDAAQDTFIKAYKGLTQFRAESAFFTWLFRIAVNTCKNRLASAEYRSRKKMVTLDKPMDSDGAKRPLDIVNGSASPVQQLEQKERMALIRTAIETLSPEQKEVVVLRDIQGLSYEEIARITRLNLGTVKSRLARARMELRDKLKRTL
jgi:RNA polymerase sigma-70 factor (ECF subfamily)